MPPNTGVEVVRAARDAELTRQRILDAAIDAFAEHGFDGASTRVIAGKAGVDPRLIGRYFGSKEGLFEHVVQTTFEHPLMMVPGHNREMARSLLNDPPEGQSKALLLTIRSAGSVRAVEIMQRHIESHYQRDLADRLPSGKVDAFARAALLIAVCSGVQMQRNVLGNKGLEGKAPAALVDRLAAVLDLLGS
ncbi:TetR family transcriptional regulator [Kribbella sp. NPDC049584]|uniref:TetR/AcrR family transcriptional regulator n=1 Tax=Kribbella sp. NPDC049584 TaxID=3154833 RepID=UPI003423DC67